MTNEQRVQAGKKALQEGNTKEAAKLFAQVVKADPNSDQGWLMLAKCVSEMVRREYCFKRVLGLNPNNQEALQSLQSTIQPQPASSKELVPPAARIPVSTPPLQTKPVPAPNLKLEGAPFILDDKEKEVTPATPEFLPLRYSSQILDEIQAAASQDKSLPDSQK